jgi:hypothetical protein
MAPEPDALSPELEGLLRELAQEPNSSFLRVDRTQRLGILVPHERTSSLGMTGLSVLERHLVSVHRSELAFLLRSAAVGRLYEDPKSSGWFSRSVTLARNLSWMSGHDLRERAARALRAAELEPSTVSERGALDAIVSGDSRAAVGTLELAAASLRLEATDQGRIIAGNALMAEGQLQSALWVYRGVLDGVPSALHKSVALENSGVVWSRLGVSAHATRFAGEACGVLAEGRPTPHLNRLTIELEFGNAQSVLAAAAAAEECVPREHFALLSFVEGIRGLRRSGAWTPDGSRQRIVRGLRHQLGPVAGSIADVHL